MPVPIAVGPDLNALVSSLVHLAHSVGHIKTAHGVAGAAMGPGSEVAVGTIAGHFDAIANTIDAGNAAGTVDAGQLAAIKADLQAIVDLLP